MNEKNGAAQILHLYGSIERLFGEEKVIMKVNRTAGDKGKKISREQHLI